MKRYNNFVMGHISIDENIYQGEAVKEIGGAVFYSSCASHAIGHNCGKEKCIKSHKPYTLKFRTKR